jgi:hypothetical protein
MRSNEIKSYRTAVRYLIFGGDPAKRLRLAAILVTMALPFVLVALALALS